MLAKTTNPYEKIVLVDDEEDVLEFMSYQLKKLNYDVYTLNNGAEALLLIEEIHPQLIISDMRMPLMNGIELCKEVKKNEDLKHIPFLFLTADENEYAAMLAHESGADGYLNKTIRPQTLVGEVQRLLASMQQKQLAH
ncbi:MAG: response regulator [Bacteroidetes bacterium]|nr:response regulator [Bacteroidota bacterium]